MHLSRRRVAPYYAGDSSIPILDLRGRIAIEKEIDSLTMRVCSSKNSLNTNAIIKSSCSKCTFPEKYII